jgi:phosphate transport system protein
MSERQHFVKELEDLKLTILNMAALSRQALKNANTAYLERNDTLAQEVIDGDRRINALELEIDQKALKLLALEQPMAKDLRAILGTIKISNELERIADQAVNIAERTLFLSQYPPLEPVASLERLMETTDQMIDLAVSAFVDENADQAIKIRQMDDMADQYTLEILQAMILYMVKSTPATEKRIVNTRRSIQTIIISRCLERAADLATNIGEHVAFIVKGINIKHQKVDFKK